MKLKLIACCIMRRELTHVIKESPHHVDAEFLSTGLHVRGNEHCFSSCPNASPIAMTGPTMLFSSDTGYVIQA